MTYSTFVARLRRLSKTELIGKATMALWFLWNNEAKATDESEERVLGAVYLGRVAALAAACCSDLRPDNGLDDRALANLAGEMLAIHEPISDLQFKSTVEVPEFLDAFAKSKVFRKYNVDTHIAHSVIARASVVRTLRTQWDFRQAGIGGIVRSWEILSRLDRNHSGRIFERLSKYLNIHPRDFLRAGFFLYCIAQDAQSVGVINLSGKKLTGDVVDQFNLDHDAIELVAHRMARTCDEFREWHNQTISEFPELYRKFVPNPLVNSPLIKIDASFLKIPSAGRSYICPSPAHMIWRIQSSITDALRAMPSEREVGGENLQAELGECLSEYLLEFLASTCGRANVIELDDYFDSTSKHADFILVEGEVAIVIECKTSSGSTVAKSVVTPSAIVELWERLHDAYVQCATTVKSDIWRSHPSLSSVRRIASIVSFDEFLCPDGPAFNGFAQEVGILADIQLGLVEAISLRELEEFVGKLGITQLFTLIEQKWAAGRHADLLQTYYRSTQDQYRKQPINLAHQEKAAADLYPGLDIIKIIRAQVK